MANQILTYKEIIEKARATWSGETGDQRARDVKNILDTRLKNYSKITGFNEDEILEAFEKIRDVNTVNFYQDGDRADTNLQIVDVSQHLHDRWCHPTQIRHLDNQAPY